MSWMTASRSLDQFFRAQVEASILLDPTLVGAKEFRISRSKLVKCSVLFLVKYFPVSLIGGARSSNTTFLS